ncbi:MAG: nickel-dependent hydrogenase large subunit [Sulfuricurvum sp.]|jgi:Ni,Fe-hydrogenase I large subunit
MITHELIERIEGEAVLDFRTDKSGRVEEAHVRFLHFRGMEAILEGRAALDALVIAPRVCGICGHSHLIAAVEMIESIYKNNGLEIVLSNKAKKIREITRLGELLQNHIKWLYLIMLHESEKLLGNTPGLSLKALFATSQINKLSALFSGQWPHSSYAIPGGVTCDPTHIEVMQGLKIVAEIETFVEKEILGCSLEHFDSFRNADELLGLEGDFGTLLGNIQKLELLYGGRSYGRFLVLGSHLDTAPTAIVNDQRFGADARRVSEDDSQLFSSGGNTYAKNALYEGEFYETGPLSRAMVAQRALVGSLYAQYGDSALTRITARIDEIVYLLMHVRSLLETLDLCEPSFIAPSRIENLSGEGIGIVEAPRGSLIHRATIERGIITAYSIITPTQWNLGNGTLNVPGVAQKAMIGAENTRKASFIFRTFDVCSVCTTH